MNGCAAQRCEFAPRELLKKVFARDHAKLVPMPCHEHVTRFCHVKEGRLVDKRRFRWKEKLGSCSIW